MKASTEDGRSRFDLAKAYAQSLLESFPRTDAVSVVTLSEPAEAVIAQAAYDRRFVRERLAAIEVTQRATDTVGALGRASKILEESPVPAANRAVYMLSDFPEHLWKGETQDDPTAAVRATRQLADLLSDSATDLLLAIASTGPAKNLSVTRLAPDGAQAVVGFPVSLVVHVTNHGTSSVRGASLQFRRDGEIMRQEPLPHLVPLDTVPVVISTEFRTPGTHLLEARVQTAARDALEADDYRYLSVEACGSIPVLLVDGRPGGSRLSGHTGYLETALAPRVSTVGSTIFVPKVITESELGGEVLADYDAVILCNVQRLSKEIWGRLERFTEVGGGVMVFGGDLVSSENYNRFGYANGKGLLPGMLGRMHAPSEDADSWVGFKQEGFAHPIVSDFAHVAESGLFSARIQNYLSLELETGLAEVVLRYSNEAPALVASEFGAGRVLLCTTTANMDWTNLPAKGDYVSLMLNAAMYVTPPRGRHRNVTVGQVLREPLAPIESSLSLRVTSADGTVSRPPLVPYASGLALEHGPIERAGVMTVSIGSTIRRFAVNVDPSESRLRSMDADGLRLLVDRPLKIVSAQEAADAAPIRGRSAELSSILFYLVIVLLFGEMSLAMWFGARNAGAVGSTAAQPRGVLEVRRRS